MDIIDKWKAVVKAFESEENVNIDLPIKETIATIEQLRQEITDLKAEQERRFVHFLQSNNLEY